MLTFMYECVMFHVVQLKKKKKKTGDMFQLMNVASLCLDVIIKCVHQH